MEKGFIKDIDLLDEKVSDIDFLDIEQSIEELSSKINSFEKNAILGIVGSFGIGKSTLIQNVKNNRDENEDEKWIHFDAWQFPERKELWDGLILDTAKQIGKLETAKRHLDGKKNKDKILAIETGEKMIKTFLPIFNPAIEMVGDSMKYFLEETPAKRVFEMQEVFTELLKKIDSKKIYFVLEDIDRSGVDGLFFLETLRQFLSNIKIEKKIIVLVPIANNSYYSNLDTYLKCLDYVEFYNKSNKDLSKFVSNFYIESEKYHSDLLSEFLTYVYKEYPDMTLRKIKLILRQANLSYIELTRLGYSPNSLICIAVQMSKYIVMDDEKTLFQRWLKNRSINMHDVFNRLILISGKDFKNYVDEKLFGREGNLGYTNNIKFITRDRPDNIVSYPSTPYPVESFRSIDGQNTIYLPDFYFKDL